MHCGTHSKAICPNACNKVCYTTACDVQKVIKKAATATFGTPGPMTLVLGHKEEPDVFLGAPCFHKEMIYDQAHKDSMWSASKFITSLVVGALVDDGKLDYDAPLSTYLDWWTKDKEDARSSITMKHLLSQTAGFGDHGCAYFPHTT